MKMLLGACGVLLVGLLVLSATASAEFKSSLKQGKGQLSFFDIAGGGGEIVCGEETELGSPVSWTLTSGVLQVNAKNLNDCTIRVGKTKEKATMTECEFEVKEPGEQMKNVEGTAVKSCNVKDEICGVSVEASNLNSELAFGGKENEDAQVEPLTQTGVTKVSGALCPITSSKQEKMEGVMMLEDVQPAPPRPNFTMLRAGGPLRMSSTTAVRQMIVGNIGASGAFNLLAATQSEVGNWVTVSNKTVQECRNKGTYLTGEACIMEVKPNMIPTGNAAAVRVNFEVQSPGGVVSRAYTGLW